MSRQTMSIIIMKISHMPQTAMSLQVDALYSSSPYNISLCHNREQLIFLFIVYLLCNCLVFGALCNNNKNKHKQFFFLLDLR